MNPGERYNNVDDRISVAYLGFFISILLIIFQVWVTFFNDKIPSNYYWPIIYDVLLLMLISVSLFGFFALPIWIEFNNTGVRIGYRNNRIKERNYSDMKDIIIKERQFLIIWHKREQMDTFMIDKNVFDVFNKQISELKNNVEQFPRSPSP